MASTLMILTVLGSLGVFLTGYRQITAVSMRRIGPRFRAETERKDARGFDRFISGFRVAATGSSASGVVSLVTMADGDVIAPERTTMSLAGVNLGSTFASWCIVAIGFVGPLAVPALVVMAIALPFRLSATLRRYQYAELIGGFALALLALDFLTGRVALTPVFADAVRWIGAPIGARGVGGVVLGFVAGIAVSFVTRSSVGTVVLAMSLAARGWCPVTVAAAAALGSGIGLSGIAFFAARPLGTAARRTAASHLLITASACIVGGIVIVSPFFAWIAPGVSGSPIAAAVHVVSFVTICHALNAILLLPFSRVLPKLASFMTANAVRTEPEERPFTVLSPSLPESLDANLLLTQSALARMAMKTYEMLMIVMNSSQLDDEVRDATERSITIRDAVKELEHEVASALTRAVQMPCSRAQAERIQQQQRIASELSLIGDDCFKTMRLLERSSRKNYRFHQESRDELFGFTSQILDFLKYVGDYLEGRIGRPDWQVANEMEETIDKARDKLKKRARKVLEKNDDADIKAELAFIDIISYLEHVGDRCLVISDTVRRLSV